MQSTESAEENKVQKVLVPIFLDDFRNEEMPESLKNVLSFLEITHPDASKIDILVGLIYILMLESGFVPTESKEDVIDYNFNISTMLIHSKQLPRGWKSEGIYILSLRLPNFDVNECKIACCSSADDLLVNCIVKGIENGHFSTCLDPLAYFLSSSITLKNVILQNLHDFSTKVKNAICYPAKQCILRSYNIRVSCLEALPPELIIFLTGYLNTKDSVHFSMTNKYFHDVLKIPNRRVRRPKHLDYMSSFIRTSEVIIDSNFSF